jgi:hypothetical protein
MFPPVPPRVKIAGAMVMLLGASALLIVSLIERKRWIPP